MSAAHLSHKIHWQLMADYVTPEASNGISLPTGECGRIHLTKKKHRIQVDHRKYISDDDICASEDCETTGTKMFYKSKKRGKPFAKGAHDRGKALLFSKNLFEVIHEFALTELAKPVESVEYTVERTSDRDGTWCQHCDDFVTFIEFGDKKKLFELSESELKEIFSCQHGGQAVGNNMNFLMYHIFNFYVYSNVIVYLNLEKDLWPHFMNPDNYTHPCDGQTFLPHSRKYLKSAMIDVNQTRELSKNLFRFLYFFEMMHMRLDRSYKLENYYGGDDPPFRAYCLY